MIPEFLISDLRRRYAEPQRHYHTWAHIQALLSRFRRWDDHFHRPQPVLWALYWHDAIYDPQASDNEEQSALLLEKVAAGHLPPEDIAFAATIIRATADHKIPEGMSGPDAEDLALFLDMDLSGFAMPEAGFEQMQRDIRAEYAFVPEDAYRKARGSILKDFLNRDRLYITDFAHNEWDAAARANLRCAVDTLESEA